MKKLRKPKSTNPKKVAPPKQNPLLEAHNQAADYEVVGFLVQPILSITKNGEEENRIEANARINVFKSGFGKTLRQVFDDAKLKWSSGA